MNRILTAAVVALVGATPASMAPAHANASAPARGAALAGHLLLCVPDGKDGLYVRLNMARSLVWANFADSDEGGSEPFKKKGPTTIHFGVNGGFDFDTAGTGTLIFAGERTPCTVVKIPT
jgi:hypothetical protein